MPDRPLPRLLYVSDVPVESSQHGSALMYRAFESYPADRLHIVETNLSSQPARRLRGVAYANIRIGSQRWLNTRLHGAYSALLTWTAARHAGRIIRAQADFPFEAVITIGHGFGWLTAAEIARRRGVPLHFIVHDDWPRLSAIASVARGGLERSFARIYKSAASRLCISPGMAEEYKRRYGASGTVMYPSRASSCRPMAAKPARTIAGDAMVIGYGGNSGADIMSCLKTLAAAVRESGITIVVIGAFDSSQQQELLALSPNIAFRGFMPFDRMIAELRAASDLLFVPMTFDTGQRDNMVVSFPSKLADYTATGVPLLVYGPSYSSVVRWTRAYEGVAEVVTTEGVDGLRDAVLGLRNDIGRRTALAERAVEVGAECFGADSAPRVLLAALSGRSAA